MIDCLTGRILRVDENKILLDVNGVGYGVLVSLLTLTKLDVEGRRETRLFVHTRVREDQLALFGFLTFEDKSVFEILIQIGGVGPKVALAIMSTLNAGEMSYLISQQDASLLLTVPGIGKRTADKILLELLDKREKLSRFLNKDSENKKVPGRAAALEIRMIHESKKYIDDVISALVNLGFQKKEVNTIVKNLIEKNPQARLQDLVRMTLKEIRSERQSPKSSSEKISQIDTLF